MRHKKWNNNKIERSTWFSCHLRLSRRLDWLWKIMAKKREEKKETESGPPRLLLWPCCDFVPQGEAGNHLGSTYITYTHFHYKFIRHSRFSLSVSLFPGTTQRCSFFYSALPFCISDQSCCVVLLLLMSERERESPLLVITVKIIFSNYRW